MSMNGIKRAALVFADMQLARLSLFEMGCKQPSTPAGKQDIALEQLFIRANDTIKEEFARIVLDPSYKEATQ